MNEYLKQQWEIFKESTTYTLITDQFQALDPRIRESILYAALVMGALIMVSFPYNAYTSYEESMDRAQKSVKAAKILKEYIKFNEELKFAIENLRSNFRIVGMPSIRNLLEDFVQTAQLPKEAVKNFTETTEDQKIMTKINSSFRLDRINYRHFMVFLKSLENEKNGIIVNSIKVTQSENLDGFLNADFTVEAYSLKNL